MICHAEKTYGVSLIVIDYEHNLGMFKSGNSGYFSDEKANLSNRDVIFL